MDKDGKAIEHASSRKSPSGGALLRDQRRAFHAYDCVGQVAAKDRKDYKIAVNDLGANILRSGLAAAMATLERIGDRGKLLLEHLAAAGVPGLADAKGADLPAKVRRLEVDEYMLATREMLQVATWLKRATQATFGDD